MEKCIVIFWRRLGVCGAWLSWDWGPFVSCCVSPLHRFANIRLGFIYLHWPVFVCAVLPKIPSLPIVFFFFLVATTKTSMSRDLCLLFTVWDPDFSQGIHQAALMVPNRHLSLNISFMHRLRTRLMWVLLFPVPSVNFMGFEEKLTFIVMVEGVHIPLLVIIQEQR